MIDNDTIMYRRLLEKIGGLRDLCYTYKEEEMRALKLRRPAWLREHGLKAGTIENATPMRCNSFMEVHFTLSINESSLDILIRYPHDKRKKPEILKTVGNLPIPLTKEFLKVMNVLKKHGLEASELFKYLY